LLLFFIYFFFLNIYIYKCIIVLQSNIPSRVVLLTNLVGAGEVDDTLQEETAEECERYGGNNHYYYIYKEMKNEYMIIINILLYFT